jgi:hypothetical protein
MNTTRTTITDDARAEYLALCETYETDPVEFEGRVLGAIDLHYGTLDDDDATDASLRATIRRIVDGDDDAATAAYWGFLSDQLQGAN